MSHAVVFRCRPSDTAEVLAWGREYATGCVWTPTTRRMRRLPRSRKRVLTTSYVMPGYLFIHESRVEDLTYILIRMGARPVIDPCGRVMRCRLLELQEFQIAVNGSIQARQDPSPQASPIPPAVYRVWPVGTGVVVAGENHFLTGLAGRVVSQDEGEVTLETNSFWGSLKISAFLLREAGL